MTQTMQSSKSDTVSGMAWVVCLSAALFFFYEFVQMNMFNAINASIFREFSLDATRLGWLSSSYFYADVLFLIPAGMLLDRISTRKIILVGMLLCVLGTLMFSQATSFGFAVFCRFLTGIGNAFAFLSCIRLASRWFPPSKMAMIVGVTVTIAMLGGAMAQTPLTLLVQAVGWRHALLFNASFGAVIIVLVYSVVRDYPADMAESHRLDALKISELGMLRSLVLAFRNSQNWFAGIYTSLLNLSIFIMGALWGGLYLQQIHHFSHTQATNITTWVFIGTVVGSPLIGFFSDKLAMRRLPMIVGAVCSIAVMLVIMSHYAFGYHTFMFLFFLLGYFTSFQILSYPLITESNDRAVTSTALGLASVLIMGGGAVFQPLFGHFLDYHWSHLYRAHEPIYSASNFHTALLILPITFIVALFAAFCVKETHAQQLEVKHVDHN